MNTVTLMEYNATPWQLAEDDASWIESELKQKIEIWQEPGCEDYWLNPHQFVGVVELPSGRRLECRPKVGIRNFFYMLAVAFDLEPDFRDGVTTFQQIDEIFEFVIGYFADLVNAQIQRGLFRSYQEREDNLTTVRGRIATREDMRLNSILRHRTYCRFTEFTWDIPENQIIRQLVYMVGHWVESSELRAKLYAIDRTLFEVSPSNYSAAVFNRFTYHRLNSDYVPIHRFCRLFLEGSTLSEDDGTIDFRTFLFDMNKVFEEFVEKVLISAAPPFFHLESQFQTHLAHGPKIGIRPDLLLRDPEGTSTLVGDCKYKRVVEEQYRNNDYYQMVSYCTALGLTEGVLICPRHEVAYDETISIQNSPIRIHQLTVELDLEKAELDAELARLAKRVWDLALPAPESQEPSLTLLQTA